jgi:serine/threonine-protein kinase RIO1
MGFFKVHKIGNLLKREAPEDKITRLEITVRNGKEAEAFKTLVFFREIYAPKIFQLRHGITNQLSNNVDGTFLQGKLSMINEIEDFIEKTIEKGRLAKPELDKLKEKQNNE